MSRIYVLHENDAWTGPLRAALEARGLPYETWFLDEGVLDLSEPPPEGVFYNRMSASSHTRGHRFGPEYTASVLAWLEQHGRRVLNGSRAIRLEISKVAQYTALERHGIRTPRTVAAVGRRSIVKAARSFEGPFITKHNRAGKGLGVRLFQSMEALAAYVDGPDFGTPIDGITLVQAYIQAPQPFITRVEMIGREHLYAVRVDTSRGFELCPADVCELDGACPATPGAPRFEIVEGFAHPNVEKYRQFMHAEGVDVAGFEMIVDAEGRSYTYDVNTNTNYNADAERAAGRSGMGTLADYLGRELAALTSVSRFRRRTEPGLGAVLG